MKYIFAFLTAIGMLAMACVFVGIFAVIAWHAKYEAKALIEIESVAPAHTPTKGKGK